MEIEKVLSTLSELLSSIDKSLKTIAASEAEKAKITDGISEKLSEYKALVAADNEAFKVLTSKDTEDKGSALMKRQDTIKAMDDFNAKHANIVTLYQAGK